jgi:hypothetical protein
MVFENRARGVCACFEKHNPNIPLGYLCMGVWHVWGVYRVHVVGSMLCRCFSLGSGPGWLLSGWEALAG